MWLREATSVAVDSNDKVYVFNLGNIPVIIFDDTRYLCSRKEFCEWVGSRKQIRMDLTKYLFIGIITKPMQLVTLTIFTFKLQTFRTTLGK